MTNTRILAGYIDRAREIGRTAREGMSEYRWEMAITVCRYMASASQSDCDAIYDALEIDEIIEINKMFPYYRCAVVTGASLD